MWLAALATTLLLHCHYFIRVIILIIWDGCQTALNNTSNHKNWYLVKKSAEANVPNLLL